MIYFYFFNQKTESEWAFWGNRLTLKPSPGTHATLYDLGFVHKTLIFNQNQHIRSASCC